MDETLPVQPKLKTPSDYKAEFARMLAEMDQSEKNSVQNRAEIERLKAETDVIKERTARKLALLQAQVDNMIKAR